MFGRRRFSTASTICRRFRRIPAQRLFAHDHFAGLCGGDCDLRVRIVGAGDVDQVDIFARPTQLPPVSLDGLIAPLTGESAAFAPVPPQTALSTGSYVDVEEVVDTCRNALECVRPMKP